MDTEQTNNFSPEAAVDNSQTGQEQTNQGQQSVDWQKSFNSLQSEYDKLKSDLLPKAKMIDEYQPYLEDVKALRSLFGPKEAQNPNNFWEKPLDQRWRETESTLEQLKRENQELRSYQTEAKFARDMDSIVGQYGKEYGDSITFANMFASALNQYYPGWENIYAQNPSKDTMEQLFFNVAGRLQHDPKSPLKALREEQERKQFIAKQANMLNGTPDLRLNVQENASEAYLTPIETI
jgi:hypothetical protein